MDKKDAKKTVFITGASSGIGREIAIRLAKKGYKVFAGVRNKIDKAETESLNENINGVYIDVTNPSGIDKAFFYVMKHTDNLDVLINNAGICTALPMEYIPINILKEQFNVNTFGPVAVTQKFLPLLKNSKVINISSMAASGIFPYISPYCASKKAMEILMNSFGLENKDNIKIIFVRPAAIKTSIWNKSVKFAKEIFSELNEVAQKKYENEYKILAESALKNEKTGIDAYKIALTVEKIINEKNPKAVYNVGIRATFADILSKLSMTFQNKLIKAGMYLRLKKNSGK